MMIAMDETQKPDPWHEWKPQWTGAKETPHDLQEKNAPTVPVAVHVNANKLPQQGQRRLVDARLWEAMTPAQQDAATQIAAAFEMIGRGMNYALSNWQRIPGCRSAGDVAEKQARMTRDYMAWAKKCAACNISHAMVVDVLCFGFSCRLIDRDRRLKSGSTRKNLMKGLALYCELRGWK